MPDRAGRFVSTRSLIENESAVLSGTTSRLTQRRSLGMAIRSARSVQLGVACQYVLAPPGNTDRAGTSAGLLPGLAVETEKLWIFQFMAVSDEADGAVLV